MALLPVDGSEMVVELEIEDVCVSIRESCAIYSSQ